MRAIRWTQNRIPKVFFFSLVIFLISFLPLDSLRSLQVLAGQPGSESSLKGLRGPERDSFRGRGFEPNLYPCNKHPFYNPRGAPLSFSENEPGGQGKELLGSIIDDFLVNDDIAGDCDQRYSATARNPSGNFVITWEDFRNGNWDIYAQRYDSSGTPLGSNFKVNDDAGTARQMNPAIAMDVLGNFVIVWEDERSGHYHIYAQRYDSSGSPIGSNFVVNDDTGLLWQWNPAIAMDYSGNFVICWTDERDIGNLHRDIYAQRYDSSGTPLGSNFEVNDDTGAAYVDEPAIAMDPSGNFVVAWEAKHNGSYDIYAQRYDSSGSPIGSNFRVDDDPAWQWFPAIAMDGSGNFVITWQDARYRSQYVYWDIYAQRYDSLGTPIDSNFRVNDDVEIAGQYCPAIAMDGSGNFVITWIDYRNGSSDIYAQRYNSSGTVLGSNFMVHDGSVCSGYYSAIAMDGFGNFVITWEDCRNVHYDIFAQRYDSSGTPLGSNFKVNDDVPADQGSPAIALDGSDNFIITWADYRNGNQDIYAQRYNFSGTPLGSNFKANDDAGDAHQVYPTMAIDGSGNFVITWEDWRTGDRDIYAQRYNSAGTPLGSNFKVNDDVGISFQQRAGIAMDGSGNFVITWMDNRNGNHDIYAQRYDSAATHLGSNFKVNDDAGAEHGFPAITMEDSGNFVIVWEDQRNGESDIYAQRYNSSGTPLGSNFKVNDDAGTVQQEDPAIAMNGPGGFVITWEDYRNSNYDIYVQRYDSFGTPLGSNFKVSDDAGTASQGNPSIAVEDSGNFVITWEDYRNGNYDIYSQRYDSSGIPLGINHLVPNSECASFAQVAPAVSVYDTLIYFAWTDNRRAKSWDIYAKVVEWTWPSICGDANQDEVVDIADVVYLINYLFIGGPAPYPLEVGDVNLDGFVNVADVVYLINYLFIGGPPPCS